MKFKKNLDIFENFPMVSNFLSSFIQTNAPLKKVIKFANEQYNNLQIFNYNKQVWQKYLINNSFSFYDSLENSIFCQKTSCSPKFNEILFIEDNYIETEFRLKTQKDLKNLKKEQIISKYTQIRVITNNQICFNTTGPINLIDKKDDKPVKKETNFFGLLLKLSKDYLTPFYNVILHIHGGSYFNQTSESHLFYLSE